MAEILRDGDAFNEFLKALDKGNAALTAWRELTD
jgi:hypothetical protein